MLENTLWMLVGITLGYVLGRRSGLLAGDKRGRAYARLELRASALAEGTCPICDQQLPNKSYGLAAESHPTGE